MVKILFVCHGNICRSPMAEFIMKYIIKNSDTAGEYEINSAAVSYEESGNGIYPPAKEQLRLHCIPFSAHRAIRVERDDYEKYDLFVVMDRSNVRLIERIFGGDPAGKVHMLLEYTGTLRDVSDPWYSGDFEQAYDDIFAGCTALFEFLEKNT